MQATSIIQDLIFIVTSNFRCLRISAIASLAFYPTCALAGPWQLPNEQAPLIANSLSLSASSGGLTIPDGRVLPEGSVAFGFSNTKELAYFDAARADNYQFGIGFFKYFELSGRLANYPRDKDGTLGARDLSANFKFAIPQVFRYQPDIAVGINDVAGGAAHFRSEYMAVTEKWDGLKLTVGGAHGGSGLGRTFGDVELALGRSGFSAILERNGRANRAGLRFASTEFDLGSPARLVFSAQKILGTVPVGGGRYTGYSFGANLVADLGRAARMKAVSANAVEPTFIPPPGYAYQDGVVRKLELADRAALPKELHAAPKADVPTLGAVKSVLVKAGFERVRVGTMGSMLVIEVENHRYNRNEADALGIALAVGALHAAPGIATISVVVVKTGLPLYYISVDRARYESWVRTGNAEDRLSMLKFALKPNFLDQVNWADPEIGPRGWSQVRIEPALNKFVGTEIGVFDFALAANIQAFVPLWKGGGIVSSYVKTLAESDNVSRGILSYARQRDGLKAATIAQTFWLNDHMLNVLNVGKFQYDDYGLQNETTWFMPWFGDQVRLQYSLLRHDDVLLGRQRISAGSLSYLWNFAPLNLSIETAYNQYVGKDRGPAIQLNKWFGDVQAQLFMRKSNLETKIGFGMAFPLTPRQGMSPGFISFEGSNNYALRLETRYARNGECNCITNGVVQEMPLVYSSRSNLLNQGRLGQDYFTSQLQRMREAALMYVDLAPQ